MRTNGKFDAAEAGRLGGLTTLRRYGSRHMQAIRRKSRARGRPRLETFDEIKGDPRGAAGIRALCRREGVDPAQLGL